MGLFQRPQFRQLARLRQPFQQLQFPQQRCQPLQFRQQQRHGHVQIIQSLMAILIIHAMVIQKNVVQHMNVYGMNRMSVKKVVQNAAIKRKHQSQQKNQGRQRQNQFLHTFKLHDHQKAVMDNPTPKPTSGYGYKKTPKPTTLDPTTDPTDYPIYIQTPQPSKGGYGYNPTPKPVSTYIQTPRPSKD